MHGHGLAAANTVGDSDSGPSIVQYSNEQKDDLFSESYQEHKYSMDTAAVGGTYNNPSDIENEDCFDGSDLNADVRAFIV